ncbi:peptidase M24 [Coprinopsis marcescibilis]|uniref:Peptidase M24 n=1 Tax=Coprinopsis marcescibilis TaxID=230819 RepID=A0A5C3KNV8_COPMA|nr:peptidase M24 [Coprinopsis marcescibilis]
MQSFGNGTLRRLRVTGGLSSRNLVTKPSGYGQPLQASHPHLFTRKDITPGITAEEYEERRKRLMESLPDNSVVVSVAAPIKYMSKNIFYKYRQASDFWYLTGFEEPNSAVVLEKTSSSKGYRMTLFSSGKDSEKEKWDGANTGFSDIETSFGADNAVPISSFSGQLKSILSLYSNVYVDVPGESPRRTSTTKSILKYLTTSIRGEKDSVIEAIPSSRRQALAPEVAKLRAVKSEAEQSLMHQAATISGRAHAKTMRFASSRQSESALAAHFEYICALNGAQRPAYVPVVASGGNALIIHYTSNNHLLAQNDLVLIDAGCEYNGYASDITRTFPASGVFTSAQRDLYSAVLSVQKQLINLCSEAAGISMQELHRMSVTLLKQELNQIGFRLGLEGDLERVLYPHYLSHPIGIDLHESTYFDRNSPLKAGNVITIEPGVYVPPTPNFPKHFHNLGVRIEDEVLVGHEHPLVLSSSAPKEIADVEGACQGLLGFEAY